MRQVAVDLGEHRNQLARAPGGVAGRHSRLLHSITTKSEELAVEEWITALSRHLADDARDSGQGRAALQCLRDA